MILINYDIGMIILHEHNRQGTSRASARLVSYYELLIDNYKYWYRNITGFSLTVSNYYVFIITNIVTRFLPNITKYLLPNILQLSSTSYKSSFMN